MKRALLMESARGNKREHVTGTCEVSVSHQPPELLCLFLSAWAMNKGSVLRLDICHGGKQTCLIKEELTSGEF